MHQVRIHGVVVALWAAVSQPACAQLNNFSGGMAMTEIQQNMVDGKLGIDRHRHSIPGYPRRIGGGRIVSAFPRGGYVDPRWPNARVYRTASTGRVKQVCAQGREGIFCRSFG